MFPNNFILFSVSSLVKIRLILDDTLFNIHTLYLLLEDALLSLYIIKMLSSWRSSYRIDRKRRFKSEFKYRFRCDSRGEPWRFQVLPIRCPLVHCVADRPLAYECAIQTTRIAMGSRATMAGKRSYGRGGCPMPICG